MSSATSNVAALLEAQWQAAWPGIRCEWAASVASTNTALAERARDAGFAPTLLVADRQTQGRGRMGRQWQSEPGASLTFSVALPLARRDWAGLSLAVGVAIADSLMGVERVVAGAMPGPRLMLKWPNDLWLVEPGGHGRKLGGILIEGLTSGGVGRVAIIGVGLNLLPLPDRELASGYASLSEIWSRPVPLHARTVLELVVPSLLAAIVEFSSGGFEGFAPRYARLDLLRDRMIEIVPREVEGAAAGAVGALGDRKGIAAGVDATGALLVTTAKGVHAVSSGEVSVLIEPPQGTLIR